MATAFDPRAFQNNAFQIDKSTGHSGIVRLQLIELYEREWAALEAQRKTKEQEQIAIRTPVTPAARRVLHQQVKPNPLIDEPPEETVRWLDIIGAVTRAAENRAAQSVAAARFVINAAHRPLPGPVKFQFSDAQHRRRRQLRQLAVLLPMLESFS